MDKNKPHHSKPYTRVTARSINRFSYFHSEDRTNRTITTRGISEYSALLGFKGNLLKHHIIKLAKQQGRKICILDSGCGDCVAIDELLSDKELEQYIQHISGVSLHYFENAKKVLEKHRPRFTYYLGRVQNVLSRALETNNAFDLIMDVWGSYPYSEDKLGLLKQYHSALKAGGQTRVLTADSWQADLYIKNESEELLSFTLWASQEYPKIVSHKKNRYDCLVIILEKATLRWAIPRYAIESSLETPSIESQDTSSSVQSLKKGNAIMFSEVVVEPTADQPMYLRPLSI